MKTNRIIVFSLILFNIFCVVFPAYAGPNAYFREFHTYGGTVGVISNAFTRLALICNHQNFPALFMSVAMMGVIIGGIYTTFRNMAEGRFGYMSWFIWLAPLVLGLPFYIAYVDSKDQMFFQDETTGEMSTVAGIPDGIITVAGFFNSLEFNLIQIVDSTALSGTKYSDMAGGTVFSLIANYFSGVVNENELPEYVQRSLDAYISDCYLYDALRVGGTTNTGDLERASGAFLLTALSTGQNPAVFTKWYDVTAGTTGEHVCNCTEAWLGDGGSNRGLSQLMTDTTVFNSQAYLAAQCNASGFAVTDAMGNIDALMLNRCQSLMRTSLGRIMTRGNNTTITGDAYDNLARNRVIAGALVNAINNLDKTNQMRVAANFSLIKDGMGVGLIANDYIPLIKAVTLTIFLGITPFLLLFIPTPIGGKALSAILGAFCFLAAWGVADAVLSSFAVEYAYDKFGDIAANGINLSNMLLIPGRAMRVLTMYGYMRMSSILFAGLISTMLFKFGGMFLSGIASSITSRVGAAGAEAGSMLDPQKQSSMVSGYTQAPATLEAYRDTTRQQGGYNNMVSGLATQQSVTMTQGIESGGATYDAQGGLGGVAKTSYNNARHQAAQARGASDQIVETAGASDHSSVGAVVDPAGQKLGRMGMGAQLGEASVFETPSAAGHVGSNLGKDQGHTKTATSEAMDTLADKKYGGDVDGMLRRTTEAGAFFQKTEALATGAGIFEKGKEATGQIPDASGKNEHGHDKSAGFSDTDRGVADKHGSSVPDSTIHKSQGSAIHHAQESSAGGSAIPPRPESREGGIHQKAGTSDTGNKDQDHGAGFSDTDRGVANKHGNSVHGSQNQTAPKSGSRQNNHGVSDTDNGTVLAGNHSGYEEPAVFAAIAAAATRSGLKKGGAAFASGAAHDTEREALDTGYDTSFKESSVAAGKANKIKQDAHDAGVSPERFMHGYARNLGDYQEGSDIGMGRDLKSEKNAGKIGVMSGQANEMNMEGNAKAMHALRGEAGGHDEMVQKIKVKTELDADTGLSTAGKIVAGTHGRHAAAEQLSDGQAIDAFSAMGNAKLNKMRSDINSPSYDDGISALNDFNGILAMGGSGNPLVRAGGAKVMSNMNLANTDVGAARLASFLAMAGIKSSDGEDYTIGELGGQVSMGIARNMSGGYTAINKDSSQGDKSTINKDNNRVTGTNIKDSAGNTHAFADFNTDSSGREVSGSANSTPVIRMSQAAPLQNGSTGLVVGDFDPEHSRFLTTHGVSGNHEDNFLNNVTEHGGVNFNGSVFRMSLQNLAGFKAAEFAAQADNVATGTMKYVGYTRLGKSFIDGASKKTPDKSDFSTLENLNIFGTHE